MESFQRKEGIKLASSLSPDIKVYGRNGMYRFGHRLMVSRLSHLLSSVLKLNQQEEDLALILPDVPVEVVDLLLELAYSGWVGGLGLSHISQIRDVCKILDMRQSDFVVRSEDKSSVLRVGEAPAKGDPPVEVVSQEGGGGDETDSGLLAQDLLEKRSKTQGSFQCESCDKTFIYAKSFERHGEICPPSSLIASTFIDDPDDDLEEKEVRSKVSRKRRLKPLDSEVDDEEKEARPSVLFRFDRFEEIDGEFFCRFPDCSYTDPFKTMDNCRNHQLLLHATSKEKIFPCELCQESFATNRLRNKHVNLMHNKRFQCDQCKKRFCEKTRLVIHMRIHTGEKPYVCDLCGYTCTQRNNLRKHKELRHTSGDSKIFSCDICQACFNTRGNLKRHHQTHDPMKDLTFVCETCGKKFKDKAALKQHSFSHGAAKYNCKECRAVFTSPLYLFRHMTRKHPADGVQPYSCDQCNKGFPLSHQLQIHIQAVHEKLKHSCPNCNQLMGRKTSLYRHLKAGRCRGLSQPTSLDPSSLLTDNILLHLQQQPDAVLHHLQQQQLQQQPLLHQLPHQPEVDIQQLQQEHQQPNHLLQQQQQQLVTESMLNHQPDSLLQQQSQALIEQLEQQTVQLKPLRSSFPSSEDQRHSVFQVSENSQDMFSGLTEVSALPELGGGLRDLVVPSYQVLVGSQPFIVYSKSQTQPET